MKNAVATIARLELATASRQKWLRLFTAAFCLLALAVSSSSGAAGELGAFEGFERTTVSLVPLVLLLVPLAALLLGVSGQSQDPGGEVFLFTQPVSRFEVILGRWIGELAALAVAIGVGFGAGAAFLSVQAGLAGLPRFLFFLGSSTLLGAVFLAIAAAIAARTATRSAALATAAFVWFFFVLLYDGVVLGAAGWAAGRAGTRLLFLSVFGNPADLVRILTLSISGTPHVLGAAGESWARLLGGATVSVALASAALLAWIAAPLELARRLLLRRDL